MEAATHLHESPVMFVPHRPSAGAPERATAEAAAWDLRAAEGATIDPQSWAVIPTGYGCALAPGAVGLICPRSGLAARHGLTVLNSPGVIDPDYEGEIQVILANHGAYPAMIRRGERIAQLLIMPGAVAASAAAPRLGNGGLGSTGTA